MSNIMKIGDLIYELVNLIQVPPITTQPEINSTIQTNHKFPWLIISWVIFQV